MRLSSRLCLDLETNRLSRQLAQKKEQGRAILDLTLSNPTQCGFSYDRDLILTALADPEALGYTPTALGDPVARQAVAEYYRDHGRLIDPGRICLTASTSEGYGFLFKLMSEAGDEILVPEPSYPLLDFLARMENVSTYGYPLCQTEDGWRLDIDRLANRISAKTRAIVLISPNNPTGNLASAKDMQALAALCQSHDLCLIIDEVFLDYAFAKAQASWAGWDRVPTFVLSGLSKLCALPQLKLGWIVVGGPADGLAPIMEGLEQIADTYLSVSAPVQKAAPVLLANRFAIQKQIQTRIRENHQYLHQVFAGSDARVWPHEGGWCAVLELPGCHRDEQIACRLLAEADVLVHPGYFYNFPGDTWLVMSLLPPGDVFRESVVKIVDLLAA